MGQTAVDINVSNASAGPFVQPVDESWFAIEVRYRFEKKAQRQLVEKGFETFLPVRRELRRWSDRKKSTEVPLFPGYVFVRLDVSRLNRLCVLQTEGVLGFVGSHPDAAKIPEAQIRDLQSLLTKKMSCSLRPFLKVGQRVRIRGGSLDGIEGILSENNKQSLIISIEAIERSLAVEIKGYEVEPV